MSSPATRGVCYCLCHISVLRHGKWRCFYEPSSDTKVYWGCCCYTPFWLIHGSRGGAFSWGRSGVATPVLSCQPELWCLPLYEGPDMRQRAVDHLLFVLRVGAARFAKERCCWSWRRRGWSLQRHPWPLGYRAVCFTVFSYLCACPDLFIRHLV
jgi:hypothetical protein